MSLTGPAFEPFTAAAEAAARARPDVDLELARELMQEAAVILHNGLAFGGLDDHDVSAVVALLCVDLVAGDPGAAVRARSRAALESPGERHDPEGVSAALLTSAAILQL